MPGDTPIARRVDPHEIAFRLAIAKDPADTTVRQTFRDWLQDRGDRWAELMRTPEETASALATARANFAARRAEYVAGGKVGAVRPMQEAHFAVQEIRTQNQNPDWLDRRLEVHCTVCECRGKFQRVKPAKKKERSVTLLVARDAKPEPLEIEYVDCPVCEGTGRVDGLEKCKWQAVAGHVTKVWLEAGAAESGDPGRVKPTAKLLRVLRWHPVTELLVFHSGPDRVCATCTTSANDRLPRYRKLASDAGPFDPPEGFLNPSAT